MNRVRLIEILVMASLLAILLVFCSGYGALLQVVFQVALGWVLFLLRVVPKMSVDWVGTATAAVCLAVLGAGLHLFLAWLYRQTCKPSRPDEPPPRWRPRWTAMLLTLVVLMFAAGLSAIGIVHQTTWLLTGPESLFRVDTSGSLRVLAARASSANNLKQMTMAAHSYHDDHKTLPPGGTFDARGHVLHGWQTLLLPYIEQDHLYKQIDLNVPWRHPANAGPFRTQLKMYLNPAAFEVNQDEAGHALSHYAANVRVMGGGKPLSKDDITDGLSNTILAGELWTDFPAWGYPANWRDPARGIHTTPDSFGSPERDINAAQFVMTDGSVRIIRNNVNPEVLRALSTPSGGETIPPGDW